MTLTYKPNLSHFMLTSCEMQLKSKMRWTVTEPNGNLFNTCNT